MFVVCLYLLSKRDLSLRFSAIVYYARAYSILSIGFTFFFFRVIEMMTYGKNKK